ncbi:MAG: hypothetical protein LBN25_04670, partial [Christensenellaceae bacterium]|nr:hypothetical protein [Christensenellaceae bacterium]
MNSIKVLTAITSEIDEPSVAVAEVLSQLELGKNQRKYSCGIIHCYSEAIETGVIKALSDALPFVTVGTTTTFNSSCGVHETVQITVTVLTSDTAQFFGGVTESYANYTGNPAIKAFNSVKATAGEA